MNSERIIKNGVSLLLSLVLLVQGGGYSWAASGPANGLSEEQAEQYCSCENNRYYEHSFANRQRKCQLYCDYAQEKETLWQYYEAADSAQIENTPYYSLTPIELFDKDEEAAQDIAFLWGQDPEYKRARGNETAQLIAIAAATFVVAEVAATFLASAALSTGSLGVLHTANAMRFSSALIPVGSELQIALLTAAKGGATFTALEGISGFMAMSALVATDMTIFESARQSLVLTDSSVQEPLLTATTGRATMQSADSARQKMRVRKESMQRIMARLREESKNLKLEQDLIVPTQRETTSIMVSTPDGKRQSNSSAFANLGVDTRRTMEILRRDIRRQFEEEGWGNDGNARRRQEEVIATVYALEYVRAEMADLTDGFRYRKAAQDLGLMYETNDLTYLPDRDELDKAVRNHYQEQQIKAADREKLRGEMMQNIISAGKY